MNLLAKKTLRAFLIVILNVLMVLPIVLGFTHGDLSTRAPIEFIIVFPTWGLVMFVLNVALVMGLNRKLNL